MFKATELLFHSTFFLNQKEKREKQTPFPSSTRSRLCVSCCLAGQLDRQEFVDKVGEDAAVWQIFEAVSPLTKMFKRLHVKPLETPRENEDDDFDKSALLVTQAIEEWPASATDLITDSDTDED